MLNSYKYLPEDYADVLSMYDEMREFYKLLESYQKKKTTRSRLFLEKQLNDLLFTIKHRRIDGSLTCVEADEIGEYFWGLLND